MQAGFTLLEMLVSLTIFALVGVAAHAMLHAVLAARETSARHEARLVELQKAMSIMWQDLTQSEPKSILIPSDPYMARFIRHGWSNPLRLPRSSLLSVGYAMQGRTLMRYYWQVRQEGDPLAQRLLTGVSAFAIRLVPPRAVEIVMTVDGFGTVRRLIEVPET